MALQAGRDWVNVTYDWSVRADKPILRYLSFLLKPLLAANHRWAMAQGENHSPPSWPAAVPPLGLESERRQFRSVTCSFDIAACIAGSSEIRSIRQV